MPTSPSNPGSAAARPPTRRDLLKAAGAASLGTMFAGVMPDLAVSQDQAVIQERNQAEAEGPQTEPVRAPERTGVMAPWWMGPSFPRSRVVDIVSGKVLRAAVPDREILAEQVALGLQALTRTRDLEQAWRAILGDARRIVLKFNAVAAEVLNTTDMLARVLVKGLVQSGYPAGRITLVEAPAYLPRQLGTRLPARGWGGTIPVGNDLEQLANYLYEADALVNVPFLKTHRIAGLSGCMKNLSHAFIRRPARYHDNGCSPYVAQVLASSEVHSRLKLNVVNALRIVCDNGPEATEADIQNEGRLLMGFDPLALDTVGLELLTERRRQRASNVELKVPYLSAAEDLRLGYRHPQQIERLDLNMGR